MSEQLSDIWEMRNCMVNSEHNKDAGIQVNYHPKQGHTVVGSDTNLESNQNLEHPIELEPFDRRRRWRRTFEKALN